MQYSEAVQEKVIGMMLSPDVNAYNVVTLLRPEYFTGKNRDIFNACQMLYRESKPIDITSVFKKMKDMAMAVDAARLAQLSSPGIFELHHIKHYIAELHEMYKNNRLEEIKVSLMQDFDIPKAFDEFNKLNAEDVESATTDIHTAAVSYANRMMRIKDGKEVERSTKTYLRAVDSIVNGFKPQDFIILGGRPAHGKTTLAMQIALNQAQNGTPIGFITMEMSSEQLTGRLLSNLSMINGRKFINVQESMSVHEIDQIANTADKLKSTKLFISDIPDADPTKIEAEIARMIRQHGIQGVFIDYLQLVSPMKEDKTKQKVEQMTNISKQFKAICKRQNIWICLISSLSRKVEERNDKRPMMADLRESGQLEYDADKVMFAYRPAAYMEDGDPNYQELQDIMEVLVRKNRNGELGIAVVSTQLQYTRVSDYQPAPVAYSQPIMRRDWNNE